jgi:predicted metal-dependent hydrolase
VSTDRRQFAIGDLTIEVVRKEIKHVHVGVYPPTGRIRVASPLRLDDEAVRLAVISRLGWIRRKRKEFERQDRQSEREMVTGESHYFHGRRYLLDVKEEDSQPGVRLVGPTTMELRVPSDTNRNQREAILQRWYRRELRKLLNPLLAKWEPRVGIPVAELCIKRMKTRWGSCNADAARIWLNLELVKKPLACLEFVLVHEMVHLHERHHTERFRERMDSLMPNWHLLREELNHAPLAHEEWNY